MSRDEANITPVSIKGGAPIKLGETFMCMDWEHGATGYFAVRPALTSPMKQGEPPMSMKNDMTRDAANMKQGEPPMSMKNDMPRDEANITPVSIKGGATINLGETFLCCDMEHGATGYFAAVPPALTSPMKQGEQGEPPIAMKNEMMHHGRPAPALTAPIAAFNIMGGRGASGNGSGVHNAMPAPIASIKWGGHRASSNDGAPTPTTTQEINEQTTKRERQKISRAKSKSKRKLLDQIGTNRVNIKRTIVTGSSPVGQDSFKFIEVMQLSEMKEIKLVAKSRGKNSPVIYGAIVRFKDCTHGAIADGRFLFDGEVCHAKDGDHITAKPILAKRLTGDVNGYVYIEWHWNKVEREWIHKSRIEWSRNGREKRIPNLDEETRSTQIQPGPKPAEIQNAEKVYAMFRGNPFLDACMTANLDKEELINTLEHKWKIMIREKQEADRHWETTSHTLKTEVLKNKVEIEMPNRERGRPRPEVDYYQFLWEHMSLPVELHEHVTTPYSDEWYRKHRTRLVRRVMKLCDDWIAAVDDGYEAPPTPDPERPYPRISVEFLSHPCIDLSLDYDIIRGNIPGSLGKQRDDAIGGVAVTGNPNKYINAICSASRGSRINERLTFYRAKCAKFRRECISGGCEKFAWNHSKSGQCYVHSSLSDKLCGECGEKTGRTWKFASKRCFTCHSKSGDIDTNNNDGPGTFCITCRSRKSVKRSLQCQICL